MIAFGVNFNFYYLMLCKKGKAAISSQEVRAYFLIILLAGGVISWNTYPMYHSIGESSTDRLFPGRIDYHDNGLFHDGL